ncbi:MAG: hypothetical protein CM1200mP24_06870 [Gammaproteobacteria bacterium]|nr:MAG: hypothetical protein CM1200mP24_06870 [Gammaproteobacteria bacterium]
MADKLFCTLIEEEIEGDTFFPEIVFEKWVLLTEKSFQSDERHEYPFVIRHMVRIDHGLSNRLTSFFLRTSLIN